MAKVTAKLAALLVLFAVTWIFVAPSLDLPDSNDVPSVYAMQMAAPSVAAIADTTATIVREEIWIPFTGRASETHPHVAAPLTDIYCTRLC